MTEKQMKERMKKIDEERDALREERKQYEQYFANLKKENEFEIHRSHIGRCYSWNKNSPSERYRDIIAFKILDVLKNQPYEARCLILFGENKDTRFGIRIGTMALWLSDISRLIYNPNDVKTIYKFNEITIEEFEEIYNNRLCELKNA